MQLMVAVLSWATAILAVPSFASIQIFDTLKNDQKSVESLVESINSNFTKNLQQREAMGSKTGEKPSCTAQNIVYRKE